jgi:pimeloyl-ACP methyl ester carboxylesterase
MAFRSGMWKLGIAIAFVAAFILLWNPLNNLVFSVRLAFTLQKMASGVDGQYPDIKVTKISRNIGVREYRALIYRSTRMNPTKALIMAPGISELGCYHPKLIAFSRFLAEQGLLVITPDIEEFRNFEISAEPINQLLLWFNEAETMGGTDKMLKAGLAGISYSGTLALIAAAKPSIRDRVAFVVCIGPYYNLMRCTEQWFSIMPGDASSESHPPKLYARAGNYARWVIMLAALDMLPSDWDRIFLKNTLHNLLLQKEIPQPTQELTSEGERWYKLATAAKPSDSELVQAIKEHLTPRLYRQLDPEPALHELRCPVFLIHGAYDDLIPPTESLQIHRNLVDSHLFISPFLTHTAPSSIKLSWKQKAAAVFDASLFCYSLSQVIR